MGAWRRPKKKLKYLVGPLGDTPIITEQREGGAPKEQALYGFVYYILDMVFGWRIEDL